MTMSTRKIPTDNVEQRLAEFPDWSLTGGRLQRTFCFDDFAGAMSFVTQVADLAERLQHHPDIMIRYAKVTLTLTTHDAGGITDRDFTFASQVDAMMHVRAG